MPRNAKSASVFFLRKTVRQAVVYGGADLVLDTDCQDLREKELDGFSWGFIDLMNRTVWWLTGNETMEQREMEEINRLPAYTIEGRQFS